MWCNQTSCVSYPHSCPVRQGQHCKFMCVIRPWPSFWRQKEKWGLSHTSCLATHCLWTNHNHPVLDFPEALLSLMRKKRLSSSSLCTGPHAASALASRLTAQTASCSTAENTSKFSCGKAGSPQEPPAGPPCSLPVARQPPQSSLTAPTP